MSGTTSSFPSPLAGEGGAQREALGGRGGRSTKSSALGNAKHMRTNPTEAERALWQVLRNKRLAGWKFKRQQPIDPYIVDFICFAERLIVEADGSQHVENAYDSRRDDWLRSQDFRLLRFWNNDILKNPEGVLTSILVALEGDETGVGPVSSPTPLPSPPPQGGREKKDLPRG
ncbi:MAG: endonuclease domain-containing protein [Sphingomonas sp.]|uniref:endonuclease domain-containing protein n=1 Tax=Sphingomonas sp. TaxID=28214 RepID=UPI003568D03F